MTDIKVHCCFCAKCGAQVKSGDPRWMDDFFLPERCHQCGDHKNRYSYEPYQSQWVTSYGFEREVAGQPRWSIWKPSTWHRRYEWVDFDSGQQLIFPTQAWLDRHPNARAKLESPQP